MNFRRALLGCLTAAVLMGSAVTALADGPVRFEPPVMTPSENVRYMDVAKKRRIHHSRLHSKRHRKAHKRAHAQAIVAGSARLA